MEIFKMICKWDYAEDLEETFDLFHEIGHCQNNAPNMRRCEQEYSASVWAVVHLLFEYDIIINDSIIQRYEDYIEMEKLRGIKRGGRNYGNLDFKKFCNELYRELGKNKRKG